MDPSLQTAERSESGAFRITADCAIPISELVFRTSRGGGPGGQNVNKVETRVELLFDIGRSVSLTDDQRARIMEKLRTRISRDGVLRVVSSSSRSQWQNKQRAIERFVFLVRAALTRSPARKKTRPTAASRARRLLKKKKRGETKRLRRSPEK